MESNTKFSIIKEKSLIKSSTLVAENEINIAPIPISVRLKIIWNG